MRLKQHLLNEKTFNISQDVDMIYKMFFDKHVKDINNGTYKFIHHEKVISSNNLKSVQCKKANEMNPISILLVMSMYQKKGSYYEPLKNTIVISFNSSALYWLYQNDGNINFATKALKQDMVESFKNELNGVSVKDTIYHELSHWLDDTFHNFVITKRQQKVEKILKRGDTRKAYRVFQQYHNNVNVGFIEINAQIHGIKEMKRNYKKIWDTLTFDDLSRMAGFFNFVNELSAKEKKEWKRHILTRMARENLIGKNMR